MTLIDADALKKKIKNAISDCKKQAKEPPLREKDLSTLFSVKGAYEYILEAIDESPTIEAEPVRHGYWIPKFVSARGNADMFECSECNANSYTAHKTRICHYKYCRNCGAKMDKK